MGLAERSEVTSRFLNLKNLCEGVEQIVAGDANSKEGVDQWYEHGYIVTFTSELFHEVYIGCVDKPCQQGGVQPQNGWCKGHDDFKIFVGGYLGGKAPPRLDIPVESAHYNPGVFVFDFVSTDAHSLITI